MTLILAIYSLLILTLFQNCAEQSNFKSEFSHNAMNVGFANSISAQKEINKKNEIILMSDYFPTYPLSRLYRRFDGTVYLKHIIESMDSRLGFIPLGADGSTYYVLHDYFQAGNDSNQFNYSDTWHMRNGPDGEVSEVADSFDLTDLPPSTVPRYGRMNIYKDQVIGHGRPGGHKVGEEPYIQDNIRMWYLPDNSSTEGFRSDMLAWSSLQVISKLKTYTPPYGSTFGTFGPGKAKSYNDVIVVLFKHGSKYNGLKEPICANQPKVFPHLNGYSSFYQKLWLAPGIGWIQIENLYYEASCDGTLTSTNPQSWMAYLDEKNSMLKKPICTNPSAQVVTNTCQEVGYPVDYIGSYRSVRQFDCLTQTYSDWIRSDSCKRSDSILPKPTCTNPPAQVVTNTCQEVGYPVDYVGSYVSTRQFDCATKTYSDWVRKNTCRVY